MRSLWKMKGRTGSFGIKSIPDQRVLYKEVKTDFRELDEEIDKVFDWAFENVIGLKWPYFVIAKRVESEILDAKICLPLKEGEEVEGGGDIRVARIRGGKFAYVRHLGSYSNLFESERKLVEWIRENNIKASLDEFRIVYVVGFDDTPEVEDYVTEVLYEIGTREVLGRTI